MITKTKVLASNYIIRDGYGDFPDNTGDWTILVRFKYPATAVGYMEILSLFDGAADFSDPYLFLGSQPGNSDIIIEIFDGSTDTVSTAVVIVNGTQNWAAITHNGTTNTQTLIVNGVQIGTLSFDLSSIVWDKLTLLGDASGGGNTEALSVAYCFAWSSIKTLVQLTAQAASIVPLTTNDLIWNTPLQTSIDLTSHNNTLNQFNAIGTVTTDLTDPLLAVTTAPPANTTPGNAITVTLDSAYFQDMLSGGSAIAAGWYKVTADVDEFWGAVGYGGEGSYQPSITPYEGLANANANTRYLNISSDLNSPIQFPVNGGNDYYFKVARNGAVTPATNQISIIRALSLPVPVGSILVNDDTFGYICAMDVGTGYPIHFFSIALNPTGEGGAPLNNGKIVICNDDNSLSVIYDASFNLIAELTGILTSSGTISSNLIDTFVVAKWPLTGVVRLVSENGVIDPVNYGSGNQALGINVDVTKLYYAENGSINQAIKTWDILSNSADPDLFAADAAESTPKGPILVLQDGKIVLPRIINGTSHFTNKIVNSSGTLLHTYDLGITSHFQDNRLATDPADPVFYWAWGKETANGFSYFNKIQTSDGSIIVNLRNVVEYESGLYFPGDLSSTPVRFGHSESCTFWINRTIQFPIAADASGLYILTGTGNVAAGDNPSLTHDNLWIDSVAGTTENVAIPNPFVSGYLVGDE